MEHMDQPINRSTTGDIPEIKQAVEAIFAIHGMTIGTAKSGYVVQFTGQLTSADSAAAYDQLSEKLKPHDLVPLFREGDGLQKIVIVPQPPEPKIGPVWVNIVLLLLTLLSVMFTGAGFADTGVSDPFALSFGGFLNYLWQGWPFAISLLGILLAHEMGHYLVGRSRGEKVTLPYFIPFPFSVFGTMGAVISMKETPKNKRDLLDIGLAGPLIGLMVAIPVLFIGLRLSQLGPIADVVPEGSLQFFEGNSIFYLFAKYLTFGKILPQPASYLGMSPWLYWLRYFFTGTPVPLGGLDVQIHPVAWAGWAGLFVTALNLIPAGQLDGGHVLYVLLGKKTAQRIYPYILGLLVLLGFVWSGWWLWAGLVLLFGRRYAEPLDQITPLDPKRKWLGILALILFLILITPVPLVIVQ